MGVMGSAEARLGELVRARREQLGYSMSAFAREFDISDATLRRVERGEGPPERPGPRRGLTDGLRWTPASIDLILAGRDPELMAQPTEDWFQRVEDEQQALRRVVESLQAAVQELLEATRERRGR